MYIFFPFQENRTDKLCSTTETKTVLTPADSNLISRDYTKFWRDKSTSDMIKGPHTKIYEKCGRPHAKWIIASLLICGILGLTLILMIVGERDLEDEIVEHSNYIDHAGPRVQATQNLTLHLKINTKEIFENKTYERDKSKIDEQSIIYDFSSIETNFENDNRNEDWSESTQEHQHPGTHLPKFNLPSTQDTILITSSTPTTTTTTTTTTEKPEYEIEIDVSPPEDDRDNFPTDHPFRWISFTSGHQNNFGVPIEEDERILKLLESLNKNVCTIIIDLCTLIL